jgi:hypothetical protein
VSACAKCGRSTVGAVVGCPVCCAAPAEYVAWNCDGSVTIPRTLAAHLADNSAAYLADGDLGALAAVVCDIAELCDLDHDPAEVHQRIERTFR